MKKKCYRTVLMTSSLFLLCGQQVLAITESDVQAQVDAAGREAVSGNVLVWFLCAIAFLKISQKIDSFMASLGINVGQTGSSMLAEVMIAAKGVGGLKNFASTYFGGGFHHSSASAHVNNGGYGGGGAGNGLSQGMAAMSGGLAGVVSRKVANEAVRTATSRQETHASSKVEAAVNGLSGGIGGQMYASSVQKGGAFANQTIGTIATGNIATHGNIVGEKAEQALSSYLGYAALGKEAKDVPSFQNVEIGGGRITGTEISETHPNGIAFGMYHTEQYTAPEGPHSTVHAADGTTWYKQYAQDAVEKKPYLAPDGEIAYKESIVKKLPPAPKRKDKI